MNPDIRIEGIPQLEKQLEKVNEALKKAAEKSLLTQAEMVRDRIRDRAPQGPTGNLKAACYAKLEPASGSYPPMAFAGVRPRKAPHGHLVEYGTVKMAAHPFFRPAVDEMKDKVIANLRSDFSKAVEESVK